MFGLGVGEIVLILFIALIFIGPKKLPGLAKGLGKGLREFQNAAKGLSDNISSPIEEGKSQIKKTADDLKTTLDQSTFIEDPSSRSKIETQEVAAKKTGSTQENLKK